MSTTSTTWSLLDFENRPLVDDVLDGYLGDLFIGLSAYVVGCGACAFPISVHAQFIRWTCFPLVTYFTLRCALCHVTRTTGLTDALASSLFYFPLRALDLFILSPLDKEVPLWKSRYPEQNGLPKTWRQIVAYAFGLATSFRGIEWNWQVQQAEPDTQPSQSKRNWIIQQLLTIVILLFVFALCSGYVTLAVSSKGTKAWLDSPYAYRLHVLPFYGMTAFCVVKAMVSLGDLIQVLISPEALYEIRRYPSLRPFQVTSLSSFWADGWHRLFRRSFTGTGSRLLVWAHDKFERRSTPDNVTSDKRHPKSRKHTFKTRQATFITGAFIASGVMHHVGILAIDGSSNYKTFFAFILQPFGILLEQIFIARYRTGTKRTMIDHLFGRLWTLTFLCVSFELFLSEQVEKGVIEMETPLFNSIKRFVLRLK